MSKRAMCRMRLVCAAVVLLVAASRLEAAGQVHVTSGSLDLNPTSGAFALTGDRGFTLNTVLSTSNGVYGPDRCNGDPRNCVPGATLSLLGFWSGDGVGGTATLDGVTYTDIGGFNSTNSMSLTFDGSLVLPPIGPSATLTTWFTFTDTFTHPGVDGPSTQDLITGGGTATVSMVPDGGFPGSWHVNRVLYSFATDVPTWWQSVDVGDVGQPGSASYSGGVFTVHHAWTADGHVVVRVDDLQNTDEFAKAGLMLRGSLDPGAPTVILDIKPDGGVEFMQRPTAGAEMAYLAGASVTMPAWLELAWQGDAVTASVSQDGSSWSVVGSTNATLPATREAGLAVTSHDISQTATADVEGLSLLPAAWRSTDVGSTGLPGNALLEQLTFDSVLSADGAGADIWGSADAFQFVHTPITGSFSLTRQVLSLQNTDVFAKAGLMFRDGLAADAAQVILDVKPDGGVEFMARPVTGGDVAFLAGTNVALPVLLRLERNGSTFTASVSTNGGSFLPVGSVVVQMPDALEAGVAVTSHDSTHLTRGVFDDPAR
jgi:hypothetical protein